MAALMPTQSVKPTVYNSIQIQTSSQGLPVSVLYGTARVSANLVWYNGFRKTKVKSGKGGALGGASGKNDGANYKYSADCILAVGEGPIQGFGQVWASKAPTSLSELGMTSFLGTYPQAAWGYVTTRYPTEARPYTGLAYLGASSYQLGASADLPTHTFETYGRFSNRVVYTYSTIPTVNPRTITVGRRTWADGTTQSMWVSNVGVTGYTLVGGVPGPGQYSVAAGVYTFNAADGGAAVEIAWNGKGQDADPSLVVTDILTNVNYGVGFPTTRVGELIAYAEDGPIPGGAHQIVVAHAAGFDDNLAVSNTVTGDMFTCVAATPGASQYTYDPTTGTYTFSALDLGTVVTIAYSAIDTAMSTYQNYCWAMGFFISPSFLNQVAAGSALEDIAKLTNSEVVWSSGAVKLVPRGDKTTTLNGHTYTAPSSTLKDLDDDDYLTGGSGGYGLTGGSSEDPVIVQRKRVSEQKNVVQLECLDRSNQYNVAVVDSTDQAAVDQYGRRPTGSVGAHMFCDPAVARISVQLMLQRQALRNSFTFKLDSRYVWLDPMDIVSVTDSYMGLDSTNWVRIQEIQEQDDGSLAFTAEEYATGTANSETYEYGTNSGYVTNYNVDPGFVNTPIIFEPSVQLATNTGLEVWCAVSGADDNWGGCDVYVSTDDVTYNYVGRQWGATRMGVLSADFPAHSDPDTVDTLSVDLTESFGELISATSQDADLGNTVCIVDSELLSYETATLTTTYNYDLETYIRRGQFGTAIAAHLIGAAFARLDENVFTFPYDKSQIGQLLYVKFCSFNSYGGGLQDISTAVAYTHTVQGPPLPGVVQDFAVAQQGGPVIFTWEDLPDFVLKGYDILYGDTTGDVSTANFLTDASRATEMTHANVPPGTWRFYIRGHDLADQVGPASSYDFTVRNFNFQIADADEAPDWFGTLTNGVRHCSGVIVPKGTNVSSTYGWEVFDQFVPDKLATPTYETRELDSLADGDMRVVLSLGINVATAYGASGSPTHVGQIRYRLSADPYGPYEDWVSGLVNARYVQGRFIMDTTIDNYLASMDLLLDSPPVTQQLTQQTIDIGGTTVFWPTPFRNTPNVQVTPADTSATSGRASSVTTTSALIRLFDGNTPVGGVASIAATGV